MPVGTSEKILEEMENLDTDKPSYILFTQKKVTDIDNRLKIIAGRSILILSITATYCTGGTLRKQETVSKEARELSLS